MIGLKDSRQFFNQWEAKPKPIAPCTRDFYRASSELQVFARNCDWFIALFAPVVIGRSNCFGFGFSTDIWKLLYCDGDNLTFLNWFDTKFSCLTFLPTWCQSLFSKEALHWLDIVLNSGRHATTNQYFVSTKVLVRLSFIEALLVTRSTNDSVPKEVIFN